MLVGDSVACGACPPCRAGRPQICRDTRWVLGGFAEALAAPEVALHAIPGELDAAGAAMAEPLAAAVHAIERAPQRELAPDAGVLGGGPMGQMLAALLVHEGRTVTLADPHAERRAQAEAAGAMSAETVRDCDVVFEAVGRPAAWRAAVEAAAPGGTVVFVGGCASGSHAPLPTHPLHYDELDLRGAFHHSPAEVDRALATARGGRRRLARARRRPDRARRAARRAGRAWRARAEVDRQPVANHSSSSAFRRSGASTCIQWLAPSIRS